MAEYLPTEDCIRRIKNLTAISDTEIDQEIARITDTMGNSFS